VARAPISSRLHDTYDPLVAWEMDGPTVPASGPGAGDRVEVDEPVDKKRWALYLRRALMPRRGTRLMPMRDLEPRQGAERQAPQFDKRQSAHSGPDPALPSVASYGRQDRLITIEEH